MPILPSQPDVFPADLLDNWEPPSSDEKWWALYTLARREKRLMAQLHEAEVGYYGPLILRKFRSPNGRKRTSYVPLFPGYVFLWGSEEDRYQALETNCVSRTLRVVDAEELVRDLRQVQQMIRSKKPLTPEARLKPGMRVRVRSGSLENLEGVVIRREGKERLLVAVAFLQQGASVSIEDVQLERID